MGIKGAKAQSADYCERREQRPKIGPSLAADLRRIDVQADQEQWKKLKIGDRVKVSYRQGKYTGTVWSAQISQ